MADTTKILTGCAFFVDDSTHRWRDTGEKVLWKVRPDKVAAAQHKILLDEDGFIEIELSVYRCECGAVANA